MYQSLRVVDLFCGMGGFSLGFVQQGCEVYGYDWGKWQYLNYYVNVSKNVSRVNLLRTIPKIKNVDVLIAGPPCKPYSRLNITKKKYERHPLFPTLRRTFEIILALKPRVFVIENVLSAEKYLLKNTSLLDGYSWVLAQYSYYNFGACVNKKRLFLIGATDSFFDDVVRKLDSYAYKTKGKTLEDAIGKYLDYKWDRQINHIWRRSKRNTKFKFSFAVNVEWDKPIGTFGNIDKMYVHHPILKRPISVREALEIYGFPIDYRFIPLTPLREMYQMLADTVSPLFSNALAKAIKEVW